MSTYINRIRLSSEILDSARATLLEAAQREEAADVPNEVVLLENVSLERYIRYRNNRPTLNVNIRLLDGKIVAYEVPLDDHSAPASTLDRLMGGWSNRMLGFPMLDIKIGQNTMYHADVAFRPRGLPQPPAGQGVNATGNPYPTMVVEIGVSESLPSLHSLARGYFAAITTIEVYLAIKVFPRRANGTRAMVALLYLRPSVVPTLVKSFGTAPLHHHTRSYLQNVGVANNTLSGLGFGAPGCTGAGIPDYQLPIPASRLFSVLPVPQGLSINFVIDLFVLQDMILNPS